LFVLARALIAVLLAAFAVALPSAGSAAPTTDSGAALIDCTCYDILRTATDSAPQTVLQNSGQNLYDLSPRSGHIVYSAGVSSLYVALLDGRGKRLLDSRYSYWARLSPDGGRIAYGVNGCGVCFVDTNGRHRHPLGVVGAGGPVAWSPDSQRVAFVLYGRSGTGVSVANIDGSGVRR
jgi:Tol biopolymer transport system component